MSDGRRTSPTIGPTSGPIVSRIGAALFLRRDFYERAAAEPTATGPAGAIVSLVALARESVVIYEISQVWSAWALILPIFVVLALLSWLLIGSAAWLVTRPLHTAPAFRRLLRCLGFAQAPTLMLATLASVSDSTLYSIACIALLAWAFAANVVALRAAAQTATGRAVLLAVPVFLVQLVLLVGSRVLLLG